MRKKKRLNANAKALLIRVKMLLRQSGPDKVSQSTIAQAMGVSRPTVRRWLTGRYNPKAESLNLLKKWLDKNAPLETAGQGRHLSVNGRLKTGH